MRPVSATFLASLRQSHVIASTVELLFPGALSTPVAVPVEDGSVTIDRTAQNRRSGTVRIPWSPRAGMDLGLDLTTLPLGGYARLRHGLRYPDGSTETVLLGVLRVEAVSWDTVAAAASIELSDRMAQVRDEPFIAPYAAAGQTPHGAAVQIVTAVFGSSIAYHTPYTPAGALADTAIYTGDRGDALSALEQAYAAETYFDANGDFVFAAKPADTATAVWTVDAGMTGVMVDAKENLDRTGIYNGVLVQGQPDADQPPISALATFDDPGSPIRWGGPFGHVALIAESTTVTDSAQALATAQSLLNLRLKQTRSLELTAVPNPALEAGDTIEIVFPDGRDETHLIDAVTIDLSTGAMGLTTRSQVAPGTFAAARAELEELGA